MSQSHGRGGAGNINPAGSASPSLRPTDLQTPTLKSPLYTTGRGGSGNMATNDPTNPAEARLAQDVEAPPHHNREMQGTYHWGRGGEGNMTVVGKSERQQSKERREKELVGGPRKEQRSGSFQAAVNKGKELLGLRKEVAKEGIVSRDESAVE